MKSFLRKIILTTVLVAIGLIANQASAQVANNYYVDPYTYGGTQYQIPYNSGYDNSALIAQILQLIQQLQSQSSYQNYTYPQPYNTYSPYTFTPVYGGSSSNGGRPDVNTNSARDIQDDSAELRGDVDMNSFNNGIVFFVYGQDENMIEDVEDDYDSYDDVKDDEENDDFEVERVDNDLDGDDRYNEEVTNLEEDEEYFFILCVEYEDNDNDERLECGDVEDFETDEDNNNEPDVETDSATDIDNNSAELRGDVEMNDFNNGRVFFVWGESEDDVEDVENEDRYSDIDTNGDDLQKSTVDFDLDGSESYDLNVSGLDDNTDHYFRICVEYEDDDNDDTLECGDVEDFETD